MNNRKYIGHDSQIYGVEEHRLAGGKGDGMRLFQIRNGQGLEFTVSADRCADISRLSFQGCNMGYFSPCGYVGPQYYDDRGDGFLKSFTAGFLTTCGLTAVGTPCVDEGEDLPLHGTVANCPAEQVSTEVTDHEIILKARMVQARIFGRKLILNRKISCSLETNEIQIQDEIENQGSEKTPLMLLYHINMGYPLLSENAELFIPSKKVTPRNAHASEGIDVWDKMTKPTAHFEEQCYFHSFEKEGLAAIYNPSIGKGLTIRFDAQALNYFVEWKMMGERDYVLGLEPGNCHPDGRDKMREEGCLTWLEPDQRVVYHVNIRMIDGENSWKKVKDSFKEK